MSETRPTEPGEPVHSPSLAAPGGPPAFELKFHIPAAAAAQVEEAARRFLAPDPWGDAAGAYQTTTLYLDTPELDVFHRSRGYRRRKYRIRRYGLTTQVYLERKTRRAGRVAKRRSTIPEADLAALSAPLSAEPWPGLWFHERTLARRLAPAALVLYQRTALVGRCPEGPLRLTIDRDVRGVPFQEWRLAPAGPVPAPRPLLDGTAILELKFIAAVPRPFRELMNAHRLTPAAVSKYRLCRSAWMAVRAGGVGGAGGAGAAQGSSRA